MTLKTGTRDGMTLIEVMIAVTILATAMLGLGIFMARFARTVANSDVRNTANELAAMRLEQIKTVPRYAAIDTGYPGTEQLAAPYTGYSRTTAVSHTGGTAPALYDYRTVTVTVTNPRLTAPVKRTTIIAAF